MRTDTKIGPLLQWPLSVRPVRHPRAALPGLDLRYVDDFALFGDSKRELWAWKRAIVERLGRLRLTIHETAAQVLPTRCGIPWLGFLVYPTHRLVKARKLRATTRHLGERLDEYLAGRISFGELDASVKGWVNHIRYADTWGLRRQVFRALRFRMRIP